MTDKPATYEGMTGAEFMREAGDDPDKWAEAAMEWAEAHGMTIEREWLRRLLADAMDAARKLNTRIVP